MEIFTCHLPICSVCTAHLFLTTNPPYQLSCKHLFCYSCLQDFKSDSCFLCPFDKTKCTEYQLNQELLRVASEGVEALQHKNDPRCSPFLSSCYAYIVQVTNTEFVPCRSFYNSGACQVPGLCPYDHSPGLKTRGTCPRGMECQRKERCALDHQPAFQHIPLTLHFREAKHWYQTQQVAVSFTPLSSSDEVYRFVFQCYSESMLNSVIKIERVENARAYFKFANTHESLSGLQGAAVETKWLFHGSGKTNPYTICSDSSGLDSRLSRRGQWGKGCYFSQTAFHAAFHAHRLEKTTATLLLCDVIIGNSIELEADPLLTRPPKNPKTKQDYHSVTGKNGEDRVWVTYEPGMAYPEYLITYSNNSELDVYEQSPEDSSFLAESVNEH